MSIFWGNIELSRANKTLEEGEGWEDKTKKERALYEFRAETRLTVYRPCAIPNQVELARPWAREDP